MSVGAPPSTGALSGVGSLKALMDGLVPIQAEVPGRPELAYSPLALTTYRWRPAAPDLPSLWNVLLPSRSQYRDTARIRDTFVLSTRIGGQYTDVDDHMEFVEAAADAYRAVMDPSYWSHAEVPLPLSSFATWAERTTFGGFAEEFGQVPVMGIEFVTEYPADRIVG